MKSAHRPKGGEGVQNSQDCVWTSYVNGPSTSPTNIKIVGLEVSDVRFPTSFDDHGSDASHPAPDYSAVYVRLITNSSESA